MSCWLEEFILRVIHPRYRIKVDGEGLIPEDLNKVLEEWDEEKRGFRRPRVLYTVPTGQNPTGKFQDFEYEAKQV